MQFSVLFFPSDFWINPDYTNIKCSIHKPGIISHFQFAIYIFQFSEFVIKITLGNEWRSIEIVITIEITNGYMQKVTLHLHMIFRVTTVFCSLVVWNTGVGSFITQLLQVLQRLHLPTRLRLHVKIWHSM